ncbi:apolipoprotein D and lipocalin family protein [Arcticibacter pallidicorallinus]|uniref:Apolipoprotein D and lipocalin family protein n=1 Tax=Arcticibacter pallidicorallinus TaxID=1259464 RepID=A0A2T0U7J2_9SPHI|nr:lipocalin family protein [Arcticibacter pallidicorallinus]PRY53883.1 apolipoprotein D and lipocalin family protein [Arcticibacter pallidicorallinus]
MKKTTPEIAIAAILFASAALVLRKLIKKPLDTVPHVELEKYLGKWYEIASFPQKFQKGCTYTSAHYSLNSDNTISVKNSCIANGEERIAMGIAKVTDKKTNAKLNVQFQWPFKGKYWILELAPDYSYAMVGHPNRNYLWILSRKPWMEMDVYKKLLMSADRKGFDVSRLRITPQKSTD